jgi:hypothetical protein
MRQEVKQVELRVRCDSALRQQIKDAAEDSVRSMSAESAFRLRKSFELGEAVRVASSS